jgi:sec-independent protein translocase protein TatB
MFGIGFTELLLIAIIAILFLGPDKLPDALVEMAKFIKSVKKTIGDAKSSLEEEMKIADLKEEALNYKRQLTEATEELKGFKNIQLDELEDTIKQPLEEIVASDTVERINITTQIESKNETVTFKKKPKTEKKETKGDA